MRLNSNALAQIALEKPVEADMLIHKLGYELPGNPTERVEALEQLLEVEQVEEDLVALLPESEAQESCFCGGCGQLAYTGDMQEAAPAEPTPEQEPVDRKWVEAQFGKALIHNLIALGLLAAFIAVIISTRGNG